MNEHMNNSDKKLDEESGTNKSEAESNAHSDAPVDAPVAPQPPAPPTSAHAQPPVPTSDGQESYPAGQPESTNQQAQSPNAQNQVPQQKPTYRENGAFSFFATPSDPDEDSAPMSIGFKIGWLVLGLIGGMLGLVMAWISTTTLSPKRRRQALLYTWIGFAIQAVLFIVFALTGTSFPFGGNAPSQASSAQTATGSGSAFG